MGRLVFMTEGLGFYEVTKEIREWAKSLQLKDGLLTLFVRHTSASVTIQENADPTVLQDLQKALANVAPENGGWLHSYEGSDDMPAHIKTMLTGVSLQIPVVDGELDLGTWQGIYLIEHRRAPHRRSMTLHYLGS
ncbi:secondary thiamine-phosphate synthase enzyme YjbQ [Pseudovibrio ascidiaceicola]|uniref:secondary thiamine-phosphate synthase enzyme YjbQ n=1 Tax=Pseudovibrio ascidiaceicola TaxID=285279 RepID=UPI003D35A51B